MKIIGLVNARVGLSFRKALSTDAVNLMDDVCNQAEKRLFGDNNSTMLDYYSYSSCADIDKDVGVGTLNSKNAIDFLSYMKPYVGFSRVKDYPIGRFLRYNALNLYCPYDRSSITIGEDTIDLSKLLKDEYGNLLKPSDIDDLVIQNVVTRESINKINYENLLGKDTQSPVVNVLRKAWKNFNEYHSNPDDILRIEYENYKNSPIAENYDRLALYPFIGETDTYLFENYRYNYRKRNRFESYKIEYKDEIDFFIFRQFIAYKQRLETKKHLNELGIEVDGDVPIGYGPDEIWAFSDAFDHIHAISWGFPILKYKDVVNYPNSEAAWLLKQKFALAANLYDGIRVDVGVAYESYDIKLKEGIEPSKSPIYKFYTIYTYENGKEKQIIPEDLVLEYVNHGKVIDFIENVVKDVKGKDYDFRKITYEADGSSDKVFDWHGKPFVKDVFKNRNTMFTTNWERKKGINDYGWGSVDFFLNVVKMNPNSLTVGTNNHDGIPLRAMAVEQNDSDIIKMRDDCASVISKALKLKKNKLKPKEWVKAKFAELYMAPRRFIYFLDVFGEKTRLNNEKEKKQSDRFRYRMTEDFEKKYHIALQKDNGFNRPEVLAMVFKAKGFDKTHKDLYKKLCFFANYLRAPGFLTEKEANENVEKNGYDDAITKIKMLG